MYTRRKFGGLASAAGLLFLSSCSSSSITSITEEQILSDAKLILTAIPNIVSGIQVVAPNVIPKGGNVDLEITQVVSMATQNLSNVTLTTTPDNVASTLVAFENNINTVLKLIEAVLPGAAVVYPALSPFVVIYDSVVSLLPIIEIWINSNVSPVTNMSLKRPASTIKTIYSIPVSREILSSFGR